jgi:hypothetical protein
MHASRRITEPFLKARFAQWLSTQNCDEIALGLDPYEVNVAEIRELLEATGFKFQPAVGTTTTYAGIYRRAATSVSVIVAKGGVDVLATLADGRTLAAECKGEVTAAGQRSGSDLRSVYEALGQLIWRFGQLKPTPSVVALILPDTLRVRGFAHSARTNEFLARIPLLVALVSADGVIHEIGGPWGLIPAPTPPRSGGEVDEA